MSGERVAEGVCGHALGDLRAANGMVKGILELGLMEVVTPAFAGLGHQRQGMLRKKPLLDEFPGRVRELLLNCIIQEHAMITRCQVMIVKFSHGLDLRLQIRQN